MEDIYDILIGGAPEGVEKQKAAARTLRRLQQMGTLGAITGDPALSKVGAGLMDSADTKTRLLMASQQKAADDARQQSQFEWQKTNADENRKMQKYLGELMAGTRMSVAAMKGDPSQKPRNLTGKMMEDLQNMGATSRALSNLKATWKDEYAQKFGAGPQSKLPNTLASMGLGTEGWKESSNWFANLKKLYSLRERFALFGATLTNNEMVAWEEALQLNPGMDPKYIRMRLDQLEAATNEALQIRMAGLQAENFRPDSISRFAGIDIAQQLQPEGPVAPSPTRQSEPQSVEELSDEEIEEKLRQLSQEEQ